MEPTGATPPAWLDDLSLRPGPPWLSMGVHPLDLDDWLVFDDHAPAELALKRRLLAERHAEVFLALPGREESGSEALDLIRSWLEVRSIDRAPSTPGLHPLDQAGRLVQEDLCLLEEGPDGYVLTAASVCFPSHWRIADKLGRSVAEIHSPVAHYDEELRRRVDTFIARLRPERPMWRRNLSLHSHDELFRPEPHESPESFTGGVDGVWLRSERQTLVRLPATGAVLFTIRTQQCPLRALTDRPDVRAALAAKLRALRPELTRLAERRPFPDWVPDWLDQAGGATRRTDPEV